MDHHAVIELNPPAPPVRKARTVLVVDDDKVFCSALSDGLLLMVDDITVYAVESGAQALAIIRTTAVDLLITDLRMPAVDGRELVLWMSELRPAIPVIVMSACADPGTVTDLETRGVHFYEKPLDLAKLAGTVRALLK